MQRNEQLSKFFSSTVDPLFQPESKKKLAGYVGRVPSYFNPSTDNYIIEPTDERQFYQLEPVMVSKEADQINYVQTYPDLVNHLRFQGANIENHSRLFDQEYWSWAPPIDIDKFTNFNNYYWYPEGPTAITVTGNISNVIDVENDILGQLKYTSPNQIPFITGMKITFNGVYVEPVSYQNKTYIVEDVGKGIILVDADNLDPDVVPLEVETTTNNKDYITIARGSRDNNPWARNNHWYHKDTLAFLNENGSLASELYYLWDADAEPWDSTEWDATITPLVPAFSLDPSRKAQRPIIEFERSMELFNYGVTAREVSYIDTTTTDAFTQIQGQAFGSVSYEGNQLLVGDTILFTADQNTNINNRVFTVGSIEVTPSNFVYTLTLNTDGADISGDPVLKEKALQLKGTRSGIEYYYDGTTFVQAQRKTSRNQAPLFNLYDVDGNYIGDTNLYPLSSFIGSKVFSYKSGDTPDVELGFNIEYRNFNQVAEIVFNSDILQAETYESEPLVRDTIQGYYFYKIVSSDGDVYGNFWNKSRIKSTQTASEGFYTIPLNLQANPNYDNVQDITRSEGLNHFASLILNQDGIIGDNFANTNYRNTQEDHSRGNIIVQNEASLLKLMLMASDERFDYMLAVNYVANEYKRFRNRFVNKANALYEKGQDTSDIALFVDEVLAVLNVSKLNNNLFPFNNTRVAPQGKNFKSVTYNESGSVFALPTGTTYDVTETKSIKALSVYINGVLQIINYDYTVDNNIVTLTSAVATTDTVEIRVYNDVTKSYIPATGAVLGLTSVYKPEEFVDDTYAVDQKVIQCHDGSLHFKYSTPVDDAVFELEKRIYNTILDKFKGDNLPIFRKEEVVPGFFRETEYTIDDVNQTLTPIFTTWAVDNKIDWTPNTENETFDQGNWKTWNWTGTPLVDGGEAQGSWRAIYEYFFDTDRPHTHPWEMLGFSEKPSWWDAEYGTDYGSTNTKMWEDIQEGRILQGVREGVDPLYVRNGLVNYIPVNDMGELLSPTEAGITKTNATIVSGQADWAVGDRSPAETAFWRSSERSYFLSKMNYLLNPAKWTNLGWNTETLRYLDISDQYIDTDFGYRPQSNELTVVDNGIVKHGIGQWIANYLQSNGIDVTETLEPALQGMNVSLAWKAASFIYDQNLRFQADSYSPTSQATTQTIFVRDDDVDVEVHESNSIKESFYSGVMVEWTGTGYEVYGYDSVYPFFKTIQSDTTSKFSSVSVGSETVKQYTNSLDTVIEIPYGHEFTSKQDVFDFLISYERYLESEGWVFDEFDTTSNEILNWRYAGKEFLFWANDKLEKNAFITLSPSANRVTFTADHGMIQNVEKISRGTYAIVDSRGEPIFPENTDVYRDGDTFSVTDTSNTGIYGLRISIKEVENILVLENITRFNDTIYNPLLNLRQQRLKIFAQSSDNWNGRYSADGFIIDRLSEKNLIPNYEKAAEDFRHYYDIENPSENDDITDIARRQIGYQKRQYLDNLLIDRDTQYQFYQGFIQQKGSRNTLSRMFRSTAITSSSDVNFLEEWAFRVSDYGATDASKYFELFLTSSDIKSNPQIIRFTSGSRLDSPNDVIIDVGRSDRRWHASNNDDVDKFVTRDESQFFKRDLPNAGYVMLGETDKMVPYTSRVITDSDSFNTMELGTTVWFGIDDLKYLTNKKWDVQVLESSDLYAFSDVGDSDYEFRLYNKFTFTGDGVTTAFEVDTDTTANNDFRYFIDDEEVFAVSSSFKNITFDDPPADGAAIEVYTVEYDPQDFVRDIIRFKIDNVTNTTHFIESISDTTIKLREDNLADTLYKTQIEVWKTLRFANPLNSVLFFAELDFPNNYLYFDDDGLGNGFVVYKTTNGISTIVRNREDLIDSEKLSNAVIFDIERDRIVSKASMFDPFKGIISGDADADITYKLEYDPARYTNGENVTVKERTWGKPQVGKVWWDLSRVAYIYYEMGSLEYKYQNWGKIFPNTSVDVYEWVRSPVPPSEWATYVSESQSYFNFAVNGTVKDIDTEDGPKWVERIEGNKTYYYFWVKGKNTVPNVEFRSKSVFDIATIIENPKDQGIRWIAAMDTNAFIVANVENDLSEESTVLQFNYTQRDVNAAIHHQWELLRENDEFSFIKDRHWNKMRDSLVGYDDLGKEVPDIRLRGNSRYGHNIRPRQTWFKDKLEARRVFIEATNSLLGELNLVDSVLSYEDVLLQKDELQITPTVITGSVANPTVTANEQISINGNVVIFSGINGFTGIANDINFYTQGSGIIASIVYVDNDAFIRITEENGNSLNVLTIVGTALASIGISSGVTQGVSPTYTTTSISTRGALLGLEVGDTVYVEQDENLFNYWTYWRFNGGAASNPNNWTLLKIQSFDVSKFWDSVDWYANGYSSDNEPVIVFSNLAERNASDSSTGTFVEVLDDGSGSWAWYVRTNETWLLVAKENATIAFSDALYDPYVYGFDQEILDTLPFDDIPNVEFRIIMDALRNNIMVGSNVIMQNIMFFKMVNHAHATNNIIDWAFKTSYLFVVGFSENIEQTPIYTGDGFEAMIAYINEAKPYHTKIKDIMRTFATVVDETFVSTIDWDNPAVDGKALNITDPDDIATLSTEPWINWFSEYEKDLRPAVPRSNNVRKIKSSLKFDRISAIRDDYVPALQFVNHPDYPDVLAPTPYYSSNVDSTTAKDKINIKFIENYKGSYEEIISNDGGGYNFLWKFNNDLNDSGASSVNGTETLGTVTYGDSILPFTSENSAIFNGNTEVTVADTNEINVLAYSQKAFSFAFKADNIHDAAPQVIFKMGDATNGLNFAVRRVGTVCTLYATVYEGALKDVLQTTILMDKEYVVTFQIDATAQTASLTLNGVVVDSKNTLNVTDTISGTTGNVVFGGTDVPIIGPLSVSAFNSVNNNFQGCIQYFAIYHEKALSNDVELYAASQFENPIFNINHVPFNKFFTLTTSGTISSLIPLVANTAPDFTGTSKTLTTVTATGEIIVNTSEYNGYPYVRLDLSGFVYGDNITIEGDFIYENTLSRLIDYYKPSSTQPSLQDLMSSYYLGTIVNGYQLAIDYGWDATPWSFSGWDFDTDIIDIYDSVIQGGAYIDYTGDGATNTFNLPLFGSAPWYIAVTDNTGTFVQELVIDVDYSVIGTQIVLIDSGQSWLTAGDLTTDYKLTIMDSTYLAINDYEVIVDGHKIVGPTVSGYPEEITPLVVSDSSVVTVVTLGNLEQELFLNETTAATSEVITFGGETPLVFSISGISGDTVVIEGSNSGAFAGEETVIRTVTANGSTNIPDQGAGYSAFTYYRLRISVYSAGSITASASLNFAPRSAHEELEYNATDGTGPYAIGNNVQATDDLLLSVNGVFYEHTTDYTVDTATDEITFVAGQTNGDQIDIISWDTTSILNTDPTWVSQTYTSTTIDLGAISVDPAPTEPRENSMLVFGDTGTGYRRLTPPEAVYLTGDGVKDTTSLNGKFGIGSANVDVWINNTLQTGGGTDYTYNEGGYYEPEVAVAAGGAGYTVGDVLTVSGGTFTTAVQLTVLTVSSGAVTSVAVSINGLYSVLPTNPVSVTGGTGAGATFNLTNWSEMPDTITFTTAPELNDQIGIRILGNEDYSINPASNVLTVSAGLTLTTDSIAFYSFRSYDTTMGIQTKVFDGNSTLDSDGTTYNYPLDSVPESVDRMIVTVYTDGGTIGGIKLSPSDYSIVQNVGVWDLDGWDAVEWDDTKTVLKLNTSYNAADKIVVTTFTGVESKTTHTYRELLSTDNNEKFHEIVRFGDAAATTITSNVLVTDQTINVADGSIFDENGGVVWIGGERIEYASRSANVLSGLVRGSKGTRKNKTHTVGQTIRRGDDVVPNGTELMFNNINTRLPDSNTVGAIYLTQDSGGYNGWV